ncbi:DUF1566 domain-containing protein [Ottowia flava]|uniref:DUF1566 domain-containing protein n=2 Tax=Ottowia TaxID=219181 RepID=A0ABW4KQY3_9BURK
MPNAPSSLRQFVAIALLGLSALVSSAAWAAPFTPNGAVVTDGATQMIWQRCALGQSWDGATCTGTAAVYNSWTVALATAAEANADALGGFSDWRVPSFQELQGLVEAGSTPAINATAFPGAPASTFWTASQPPTMIFPMAIDFVTGNPTLGLFGRGDYNVRLVRGGAAGSTLTISASVAAGSAGRGSVSPASQQTASSGGTGYVTVSPQPGYRLVSAVGGSCGASSSGVSTNASRTAITVREPTASCAVEAAFEQIPGVWLVNVTAPTNGSINCPATVSDGQPLACTATPAAGYQLAGWGDACAASGTSASCSVAAVTSNVTVSARFAAVAPVAVPTMGEWGLMLTGLLAAALGALGMRRRARA